jgi:4-coumarate--CoA ligase
MLIYPSHVPPVSDIPQISLFSYLLPIKDEHPERVAFIDVPTGRILTRGQLRYDARVLAYGLRLGLERRGGLNVARRSTILIFSGNSISVPLGILGALAAGLRVSMASSSLTPSELAYQIKDSEPTHLFVQPELAHIAIASLESLGVQSKGIKRRVLLLAPATGVPKDVQTSGLLNLDDIMADNKALFPEPYDGKQSQRTAMLFYSSGTTGA